MNIDDSLPGADLVKKGLQNLHEGKKTVESLLVTIGRPRLMRLGIQVPPLKLRVCAELSLYRLLVKENKETAYSLYNSYLRRLISFEHALER